MSELKERLFWMDFNNAGVDEIGYLLTMEQLLKELPDKPAVFVFGGVEKTGWAAADIDKMLADGNGMFEDSYAANETFTVKEVQSTEELKALLTWENYDYQNGATAVELNGAYPDFVPEKYRLSACVYGDEPGWTSENLPRSGDVNPTVEKYAKELGLGDVRGLRYDYTDEERAAIDISQSLQSGDLDLAEFFEILDSWQLPQPVLVASDIGWDVDIEDIFETIDEKTVERAAEILELPAERYANTTTSERHDYIYDIIHHNRYNKKELVDEPFNLPEEVIIPADVGHDEDDITDYISNEYGFCISGYTLSSRDEAEQTKDTVERE